MSILDFLIPNNSNYQNRVREFIELTSPEGTLFQAYWKGDKRSKRKKVGQFNYPKVKGTVVQDLDIDGITHPIQIFFEGPDNDLTAEAFFKVCDEKGKWTINHPTKGSLVYQLLSVEESIDPLGNGNITQFDLEFIEPADDSVLTTPTDLLGKINSAINTLNEVASGQYSANLKTGKTSYLIANENATTGIVGLVDKNMGSLISQDATISSQILSIKRGISDTLDNLNAESLAGQMQELIQLPALAIQDSIARLDYQKSFIEDLFTKSPTGTRIEDSNIENANELALMAALAAMAISVTTGDSIETRTEAVEVAQDLSSLFLAITASLDGTQSDFSGNDIDEQFFSQTQSYATALDLVSLSIQYLLSNTDLKIEKRFTLDSDDAPIIIAAREYKSTKDSIDADFDYFIKTNKLKNNDIIMLPAGREVVVYV